MPNDDPAWLEAYEERAAILEYQAGYSRSDAERLAVEMTNESMTPNQEKET